MIPDEILESIRQMGINNDLESLRALLRLVHNELDKVTVKGAMANPHPTSHDEGHE